MTEKGMEAQGNAVARARRLLNLRILARLAVLLVVLLAVPFISAGTFDWPAAWVFAAIGLIITAGSRLMLLRLNPELAAERAAYSEKTDAKPWDRLLMPLVAIYGPLATLVLAGLNRRFAWRPEVPTELAAAGAALLVLASAFSSYALLLNRFFSSVVRIQRDRGHTVVTAGPYRWIRHPGYAGGVVGHLALPLLLGSAWALIPGALTAGLTVLRTALEDRTLHEELPGYAEYARQTRYRLLPGVW